MTDKREVAEEVKNLLEYAKTLGMKEVPVNENNPRPATRDSRQIADNGMTPDEKATALIELQNEIGNCTRCKLHTGRTKLVFGQGDMHLEGIDHPSGPVIGRGVGERRLIRSQVQQASQVTDPWLVHVVVDVGDEQIQILDNSHHHPVIHAVG